MYLYKIKKGIRFIIPQIRLAFMKVAVIDLKNIA